MAGHGIAMLMPKLWTDEIAAGHLVTPFPEPAPTGQRLWLVCPRARGNAAKVVAFRAWAVEEFKR